MFRTGYILGWRADLFWFLSLPFLGIGAALASQQYLPAVALAATNLWITVPHHFATWLRTYGLSEDFTRFRDQLIIGPVILLVMALAGLAWAPLTVTMVVILWDHQHSIMQQHGFARIYDFKAGTGAPSTRQFDLALNWILYLNLMLTAPLFASLWLRWLYRWGLGISPSTVLAIQAVSWGATGIFLCVYGAHVIWCVWNGHRLNPIKFLFIGASFFLWYFTAWHTASWLVQGIAHRVMHGLQYIVIVYWYVRRKLDRTSQSPNLWARALRTGNVTAFVSMCAIYAVAFQLITRQPFDAIGFGVVNFVDNPQGIPEHGLGGPDYRHSYDLFASAIISTAGLTHYYFDSFIWKVRDQKTQEGL